MVGVEEEEEEEEEACDCIVVLTVSKGNPTNVPITPAEKPAAASLITGDDILKPKIRLHLSDAFE